MNLNRKFGLWIGLLFCFIFSNGLRADNILPFEISPTNYSGMADGTHAFFTIQGLPAQFRIFVGNSDYSSTLVPEAQDGVVSFFLPTPVAGTAYSTQITVEAYGSGGSIWNWQVNQNYSAGQNITLDVQFTLAVNQPTPVSNPTPPPISFPGNPNPLPTPGPGPTTNQGARGHLRLLVTPDAFVYINTIKTVLTGTTRDFTTPPIADGMTYSPTIKFDYRNKDGRRIIRTLPFVISPGQALTFDTKTIDAQDGPTNNPALGRLHVVVTLDTILTVNGTLTTEEGEVRDFDSPAMGQGQTYTASVKFDFVNRIGQHIVRTKDFVLPGGQTVDFENIEGLATDPSAY